MLDHKRIELGSPIKKNESQKVDSENAVAHKRTPLHDKCNAENLVHRPLTNNVEPSPKPVDKVADKSCGGPVNNVLFEKNQIETTTNQLNNAHPPVQVKKKLNLEEYLKRRPDLKLQLSKASEIKTEPNWPANQNDAKPDKQCVANSVQDLYEEIIVVSIGSNTDVTIPFNEDLSGDVKSIKLISKISGEHITSNSLIASIRDVIIKKSSSLNCSNSNNAPDGVTSENEKETEHGEDKTIMHLKKDRIRNKCVSVAVQTDCDIRFPVLERPKIAAYAKSLSRSPSTSSRSSYSSYSSDNRKSKDFSQGLSVLFRIVLTEFFVLLQEKAPTIRVDRYRYRGAIIAVGRIKDLKRATSEAVRKMVC